MRPQFRDDLPEHPPKPLPFLPERSAAKRRQKLGRGKRAQRSEHAQGGHQEGRRVGKQINGSLQRQYVWSNSLRIAAELDGTGEVVSRFIYGNKVNVPDLIAKPDPVNGDRLYRVITDQLGSPIYVVNIADPSDVLLDATYDEWGMVESYASSTGVWPIPFGFAGGLYDEDTGLVRFGARDYDPRVGRWTAKDPIRWDGGQANLYVYVGNDSVNRADPSGLWGFAFGLGAGAGLGFPLGFGAEAGVGIALDYTPGQGITAADYKSTAGYGGAGVFGGAGVDLSFFSNIENFAGTAVEGKIDLGLLGQGGIDVGRPLSGKAGSAGVLTATLGVGAGLFVGLGLSSTELEGFRINSCGDGLPYSR